jgi:hypothetical protein
MVLGNTVTEEMLIRLPPRWVNASILEDTLRAGPSPLLSPVSEVDFRIPRKCNLMTDAAVRLLSLLNQLDYATRRVVISFEESSDGVLPYLNRIGFFQALAPNVTVLPRRPTGTAAVHYQGRNPGVVEIARIDRSKVDKDLPTRLAAAVARACERRRDVNELEGAAWTIFAELIENVFEHSSTPLDGFAALQVYHGSNCLKVAVSDSGQGMLETLRPALKNDSPRLAGLKDVELLVKVFKQGLSRHGPKRGCGLKGCADKAIKFRAELDVRLPQSRVILVPSGEAYALNKAFCYSGLPLIWGTHLCFTFQLD